MQVHSELGFGFIEKVYENSLMIALEEAGLTARQQMPIGVKFRGRSVGVFFADILVNNSIILELKAAERIREKHKAQTLHYLKATQLDLGFLFNFGQARLEHKRFIYNKRGFGDR